MAVYDAHIKKDMTGKNVVITGSTSGIGLEAARVFAYAGAKVYMVNRNPTKNAEVVERLTTELGASMKGSFEFVQCDLMKFSSVYDAIKKLKGVDIDVLVLNAGLYAGGYKESEDGFETTFQSCHLSHFILEKHLDAQIVNGGRVVVVASDAHTLVKGVQFPSETHPRGFLQDKNGGYSGLKAYGQAKAINILFADGLSQRIDPERKIVVTAVHPGAVATSIWPWFIQPIANLIMLTPPSGAAATIWCAMSDEVTGFQYYGVSSPHPVTLKRSKFVRNQEHVQIMWEETERIIAPIEAKHVEKLGVDGSKTGSGGIVHT